MRKSTEARHNISMLARIRRLPCLESFESGAALGIVPLADPNRALLHGKIFRVLQGQVEESSRNRIDFAVQTAVDRIQRQPKGAVIAGKCPGPAPMHVAGELIENDDQSESRQGLTLPTRVLAGHRQVDQRAETILDQRVVGRVRPVPEFQAIAQAVRLHRQLTEPELDDVPIVCRRIVH